MEIFYRILKLAVDGGASDIHIKVGTPVIFRINRQLVAIEAPLPTEEWVAKIVKTIVPPHAAPILEREREVDFSYYLPNVGRYRTNVFQQRGQFALAMRYVKTNIPSFAELGLLDTVKSIAEVPRGIVLVAGTTGSGKSTTLAAMLQHINSNFKRHVITLEDPIEYVFDDLQSVIEQREVGLDSLSFHNGLKNVLRQDPDIIMIGEMRDSISFAAAISAADTGHLVLSTLHTTNASQSVTRILDFFPAEEREQIRRQLAGTLQAVICQRMVGTVNGGMTPALEIMIGTPAVRNLIREGKVAQLPSAIQTGQRYGMITLDQSLRDLVMRGIVSKDECLHLATGPTVFNP